MKLELTRREAVILPVLLPGRLMGKINGPVLFIRGGTKPGTVMTAFLAGIRSR